MRLDPATDRRIQTLEEDVRELRAGMGELRDREAVRARQMTWMVDCLDAMRRGQPFLVPPPRQDVGASTSGVRRREDDSDAGDRAPVRHRAEDDV